MALIWNALVGKTADLLNGKRELVWYGVTMGQVGFGVLVSRLRPPNMDAAEQGENHELLCKKSV